MTYKTIGNACNKALDKNITFGNIMSKRFYHKDKGWTNLTIHEFDMSGLLDVIGGTLDYRRLIMDYIRYGRDYGIFNRLIFNGKKWSYCAGQDYVAEMNTIRKILRDGS